AQTLKTVKDRGQLSCGVSQGLPGFSSPDDKGNWAGLDVDICRAIAAAIFNDAAKVKFVPLSAKDRFTALQSGEIDVLSRTTTEQNLADYFRGNNMKYEVIAFTSADETVKAYESGRCDVFTSDVSQLYA